MEIELVNKANGESPFQQWLDSIADKGHRTEIVTAIQSVAGDESKSKLRYLKDGVTEIKIDLGPGYRVYFATIDNAKMLLLGGGSKKGQDKDIESVKALWKTHTTALKNNINRKTKKLKGGTHVY